MSYEDDHSEASEEEEECRVCRGPAEEGRPLYAPCKCSGSIGLVHQDCLTSWLAVTRGNGQCELCGLKFQFAPRYKQGAPDHLSPYEVFLGLCSRATEKWLPLALRIVAAISLWLGVVPLTTAYLYHGWMHRPSSIISRLKWELVLGDLVSGVVIASFIIVTFLSFMSFADFLRFNWQQDRGVRVINQRQEEHGEGHGVDEWDMAIVQLEIINRMKLSVARAASKHQQASHADDNGQELELMKELFEEMEMLIRPEPDEVPTTEERRDELQRHFQTRDLLQKLEILEADNAEMRRVVPRVADPVPAVTHSREQVARDNIVSILRRQNLEEDDEEYMPPPDDDDEDDDGNDELDDVPPLEPQGQAPLRPGAGNNVRFDRFDPLPPGLNPPDDDVDMDINVALDELLGLRGPFNILVRNVFWLLAFNTTYLGLFAFIPKNFGSSVYSIAFNRTVFSGWLSNVTSNVTSVSPEGNGNSTFGELVWALNEESRRLNTTLRLPDLVTVTLGYLSIALLVVLLSGGVLLYAKFKQRPQTAGRHAEMNGRVRRPRRPVQEARPPMGEEAVLNEAAFLDGMNEREMDEIGGLGEQLSVALDCLKALTKVGFLLFHKMLLLPMVLGIWLDAATLSAFGNSRLDRVLYAGGDLFSSALLHWVVGITFMLFVTVSVLQLREVAHPGLLARVIRPQEPQPDLLSNLLHESLATHAKRMLLSFVIYAALLSLHVWLPARILVTFGIGRFIPFTRLHFAHILMPQLQVPLELFVFHLTMLALLEKYKNRIGEMQHSCVLFLCNMMGLTEYVLPRSVEKFAFVGSRPIFLFDQITTDNKNSIIEDESAGDDSSTFDDASGIQIDPFWYKLAATKPSDIEEFLSANIGAHEGCIVYEVGTAREDGHRIPRNCKARIALPPSSAQREIPIPLVEDAGTVDFLPTSIGPFRLCPRTLRDNTIVIEFWREIPGSPIPRPPEGWDDLGIGGAEIQGRWAWGKERKSSVENGAAQRTEFFGHGKSRMSSLFLILKFIMVFILSWFIITIAACFAFSFPLMVGCAVFTFLRVPGRYMHDPFAFAIGICLWNPTFALLSGLLKSEHSMLRGFLGWASAFRLPPFRKVLVVSTALFAWLVVSPLFLGTLYDLILLKDPRYFSGEQPIFEASSVAMNWATGTMLLNAWALLCYHNVFTWSFWVIVGNAALEAEFERVDNRRAQGLERNQRNADNRDDHPNIVRRREDGPNIEPWQGEHGRFGHFVGMLTFALLHSEWDVVDHEVLLQACAFPVTRQILIALATPSVVFAAWLLSLRLVQQETANIVLPFFGEVENALYRAFVFRAFAIVTLLAQFAATNQAALRRWFQAAHKTARDSRYLEGEILLNYSPL